MNSQPPLIPEEILRSEAKRVRPAAASRPGLWRFPGLPQGAIDWLVKYGPFLVLTSAAFQAIQMVAGMRMLSSLLVDTDRVPVFLSVSTSLTGAVGGVLAFIWLREGRQLGWNALVLVLIVQAAGGMLAAGQANILVNGFELVLAAYILLQLRNSYPK